MIRTIPILLGLLIASPLSAQTIMVEGDRAMTPHGARVFCAHHEEVCMGSGQSRIPLTEEVQELLLTAQNSVNSAYRPLSDIAQYGEKERWALPSGAADCEDYALAKREALKARGIPASALRIAMVLDENARPHAVLIVATDQGGFVLDNRFPGVVAWENLPYCWRKRTTGDLRVWVSIHGNNEDPSCVEEYSRHHVSTTSQPAGR